MKKDATEKTLSALSKKVGQSVRTEAKSVKKTLLASCSNITGLMTAYSSTPTSSLNKNSGVGTTKYQY